MPVHGPGSEPPKKRYSGRYYRPSVKTRVIEAGLDQTTWIDFLRIPQRPKWRLIRIIRGQPVFGRIRSQGHVDMNHFLMMCVILQCAPGALLDDMLAEDRHLGPKEKDTAVSPEEKLVEAGKRLRTSFEYLDQVFPGTVNNEVLFEISAALPPTNAYFSWLKFDITEVTRLAKKANSLVVLSFEPNPKFYIATQAFIKLCKKYEDALKRVKGEDIYG